MNIFIKSNFNNKNYNHYFNENSTLYEILEYYLEKNKINLNTNQIYILFNNKILKKNTSLTDNNISDNSTIYINYNYNTIQCTECLL
jgi:hypothetical protein